MTESIRFDILMPIILYFISVYIIGFYSMKFVSKAGEREGTGFLKEYLIGDRDLNGFVLAMTLVATFLSAGSFIGGPGSAYTYGLAWVFLTMAQMPTGYFTLGILGKKFAIIARKINAFTITDFLNARYESKLLAVVVSLSLVFFIIAAMTAQVIGASRIMQGALGVPYQVGLVMITITIMVYTIIGGFRAVVLTDALQGIVMTVGTIAVIIAAIIAGGGVSNLVNSMREINPGLISPYSIKPEYMTMAWVTSYWILVGYSVVGLPQVAVRGMAYKDCKSLNQAIIYGTVVSMVLLLGMHLLGAFGVVLIPGIESGDLVVPMVTTMLFPNWVAGLVLAGPLAAVMSTVDSQLLLAIGAIVNDIYTNIFNAKIKRIPSFTFLCSLVICAIVFVMAFYPPDLMVWLNLYASAGLKATFLWPIILGLYWKRANAQGAFASVITGIATYIGFNMYWPRPLGMHTIVLPLIISLIAFVLVSYMTEKPSQRIIETFWGI